MQEAHVKLCQQQRSRNIFLMKTITWNQSSFIDVTSNERNKRSFHK